jgi:dinuclear metal center YbgI/SA1388 family protein
MTLIRDLIRCLEGIAPPIYQEDYDNAGLIVGDPDREVRAVLVCLDATEAVIREAIERGCNVVVAHHPIIFKGLKKITGATYVERSVILAIRHEIAIYAIHTNLDNMYHRGVNGKIGERLGLAHTRILAPKTHWHSLRVPLESRHAEPLRQGLLDAGFPDSTLTLFQTEDLVVAELQADPAKIPILEALIGKITNNARYTATLQPSLKLHPEIGAGLIGSLPEPISPSDFLDLLKDRLKAPVVRHTAPVSSAIQTVALCGGAGSFLLRTAIAQKADAFVSADFKYHEFFDAEQRIMIADIGHYESEQFTTELLQEIISQNFTNFAAYCAKTITNPVLYC